MIEQFDRAVQHWSRIRAFAADKVGTDVAGIDASARALIRSTVCAKPLYEELIAIRRSPDKAKQDIVLAIRERAAAGGLADPEEDLAHSITHPSDSHPPTIERLKALGFASSSDDLMKRAARAVKVDEPIWFEPMFVDLPRFSKMLTQAYTGRVTEEERAYDNTLAEIASLATDVRELCENPLKQTLIFGGFAALTLLVLVMFLFSSSGKTLGIALPILLLLTAAFGGFAYMFATRGKSVFIRLSPEGLQVLGCTPLVPWTKVTDIRFVSVSGVLGITYILEPGYAVKLNGSSLLRVKFKASQSSLQIDVTKLDKLTHEASAELMSNYWRAGNAAAAQQERRAARAQ